jgi:two-component system, LytTR family, sensor histidine kinase AlgZ
MHPFLLNPRKLAMYLLSWVPFAWFVYQITSGSGIDGWPVGPAFAIAMGLLYAFLALSARYSNALAPFESSSTWKILGTQVAAGAVTILVWLAMGTGLLQVLARAGGDSRLMDAYLAAAPRLAGVGGVGFAISAIVHYLETAAARSRAAERRALELQVVAREAELKTLRAQIDPHFLFNSLHSISALTLIDPPAARQMCVRLGDFLRTTLKVGQRPFISLGEELGLVCAYLGIEQVRLGSRLRVDESVADGVESTLLPPLLLHPLVENAVTHGIGQLVEGGRIEVTAAEQDARLHVRVGNTCDPDRERRRGTGVGLENVRRRLETVYGRDAAIAIRERPDWYEVEIAVPRNRNGASAADGAAAV